MARTRLSTTVDTELIDEARRIRAGSNDAELIDAALLALLRSHRRVEIDQAYDAAYGAKPIETPDEWGDLASFREAASGS